MKYIVKICCVALGRSPPVWGAWIEIASAVAAAGGQRSPPVWGAWIEIVHGLCAPDHQPVAPRMGGVD